MKRFILKPGKLILAAPFALVGFAALLVGAMALAALAVFAIPVALLVK